MVRGPFGQPVSKNNWQFELFLLTGLRVSDGNPATWLKARFHLRAPRCKGWQNPIGKSGQAFF
jgi:hypothetical protein